MNLKEMLSTRMKNTRDLESQVKQAQNHLKAVMQNHADAMQELRKVEMYKNFASQQIENDKKFFKWIESSVEDRYASNGKRVDFIFYKYEGITWNFNIEIKHRKDLKVWKYEVEVKGHKMHFEDFSHLNMYDRDRRSGYSKGWSNELKKLYSEDAVEKEIFEKFKTLTEAKRYAHDWKKKLEKDLKKELDYDKEMYSQACKKYDNVIRIELDVYSRDQDAFYQLLEYNSDVNIISIENRKIELEGSRAKEFIQELKDKYKIGLKVLAG